jgi:hypothetical protein
MFGVVLGAILFHNRSCGLNSKKQLIENNKNLLLVKNIQHEIDNKCGYGPNGPRILCAVFTYEGNFKTKAKAVVDTWAKYCDSFYFIVGANSTTKLPNFGKHIKFIRIEVSNKYEMLAERTFKLIEYINENLLNEFDWFYKCDDDTFTVIENLKYFLANKCLDDKHSYGNLINLISCFLYKVDLTKLYSINFLKQI